MTTDLKGREACPHASAKSRKHLGGLRQASLPPLLLHAFKRGKRPGGKNQQTLGPDGVPSGLKLEEVTDGVERLRLFARPEADVRLVSNFDPLDALGS